MFKHSASCVIIHHESAASCEIWSLFCLLGYKRCYLIAVQVLFDELCFTFALFYKQVLPPVSSVNPLTSPGSETITTFTVAQVIKPHSEQLIFWFPLFIIEKKKQQHPDKPFSSCSGKSLCVTLKS